MDKDIFYVIVFESPNQTIQMEKQLQEFFHISVIPTPRELDKSCGIAIKFDAVDFDGFLALSPVLKKTGRLFRLSNKKINGNREIQEILV